jgi:uncharacterized RDD family membrane protein YckC
MTIADDYVNRVLDLMPQALPLRGQIATELRGHIAERLADGQSEDDVLRQLGDPLALAESYLSAEPLVSATFGQRAAAKVIDFVTIAVVMLPLAWLATRSFTPPEVAFLFAIPFALISGSIVFGVYTMIAECVAGQTMGKRLFGLRVVRESGARITRGQAVVRSLPMFLQMYWIDILFALFTEKSQRAFELLSKTRVVKVS